jgi:hypothetical protein
VGVFVYLKKRRGRGEEEERKRRGREGTAGPPHAHMSPPDEP